MSQWNKRIATLDAPKKVTLSRFLKIKQVRTVGKPDGVTKEGTAIVHHGGIVVTQLTKIPEPEAPDMRPFTWFVRSQPGEVDEYEMYPEDISVQLEMALCSGMTQVRYINNNVEYEVNLETLKQYPVSDPTNTETQMDVERAPVEFIADAQTGVLVPRRGFVKAKEVPEVSEAPETADAKSPEKSPTAEARKKSKMGKFTSNLMAQFKKSCGVYQEKMERENHAARPRSPELKSEGLPVMRMMVRASSNPVYALDATQVIIKSDDASNPVSAMATASTLNCALTGGQSNRVLEWNYDNGELLCEYVCTQDRNCVVHNVHYSPSTRCVVAATGNREIALFLVGNPFPVKTISAHSGVVYDANITAMDEKVISIGMDGYVRMWNIDNALCERAENPTSASQLCMSIRETLPLIALSAGADGIASVIDFRCPIATVARVPVTDGQATGCSLRMDGMQFATCGNGPTVRVWDMRALSAPNMEMFHYSENCATVNYTPQQRGLICSDDEGRAIMIDLEDKSLVWRTHAHQKAISRVVVNSSTKSLITGSLEGLVHVWHWGEADSW